MLDKIIGALTFKTGIYADAKKDTGFTASAWIIVGVTALLSALGATAVLGREGRMYAWLFGAIGFTIFAIIGFALACFVVVWVAKTFFNATATFDEVVRALGLARVWHVVGFLGIVSLISPALGCVAGIFGLVAAVAGFIAWLIATKEVLALEWPQTVGTVIIAWVVMALVTLIAGIVLGTFGLVGASIFGAFR